jgi:hypothetical protein
MNETTAGADDGPTGALWARHANPGSVPTLVVACPVLFAGVYRRDRALPAGTLLFVLMNPLLFDPPEGDDAWATRVVLGERRRLEAGIGSSPFGALLVAVAAPVDLYAIRSAVRRDAAGTVFGTGLSVALTLPFFGRASQLYGPRAE